MTEQTKKTFEELRQETEELLARYASRLKKDEIAGDLAASSSGEIEAPTSPAKVSPESINEVDGDGTSDCKVAVEFNNDADAFRHSLAALRKTLNTTTREFACDQDATETTDVSVETEVIEEESPTALPQPPIEEPPIIVDAPCGSALESMPLPVLEPTNTPLPELSRETTQKSKRSRRRTRATTRMHEPPNTRDTIASALKDVRHSVEDVEFASDNLAEPEPIKNQPTPPIADEMPKSVSEDLPKYPAKARTRTCNRCGNETKLRDEKCHVCGRVDASLGILDNVIAGDLVRVNQILLVKPHAIALRTSQHEWTLLHMAAAGGNPKMVELLISKGATVNAQCRKGKTPLHYAASKGYPDIVEALLQHHADTALLYRGETALQLASSHGHRDIVELLEKNTA